MANNPGQTDFIHRLRLPCLLVALWLLLTGCAAKDDPLFEATRNGDTGRVRTLLDSGADVNSRDESTRTLSMHAAIFNRIDVAQLLLDRNAEVNARNNKAETALALAAREGHPDIVRVLLRKGADVNARDSAGLASIVYAAQFNHPATLKVLLDEGKAEVSGEQGEKALRVAQGHPDLIDILKKAGAKE